MPNVTEVSISVRSFCSVCESHATLQNDPRSRLHILQLDNLYFRYGMVSISVQSNFGRKSFIPTKPP
ncbi:hypothetical protein L596_028293 [Steinernema carpocapsae]|uniref:Uncharacterized protein n=1 Tax=Steinernema carpocapsae TaxID=34508 RepID=A0A4U5LY04_STECR|nr:hypothetical protein L596_028293 [Steinernema carpocapsae]